MIMKNAIVSAVVAALATVALPSCIEDSVSTSAADQPEFSSDTLRMGRVFTDEPTPTHQFRVYNRHDKVMSIADISFRDGGTGYFRINVDGQSGTRFSNVEIRPNDSIFVFVEATLPPNASSAPVEIEDVVQFTTNGVSRQVVLSALGQDVRRLHGKVISADTLWTADLPHQIFDSLVVAPGATLTLQPGCRLYFHDGSDMRVRGTLRSLGSAQAPVIFGGDRTGTVAADIPYEVMSRQWVGVSFAPTSRDNRLEYTVIENTWRGVVLDSISGEDSGRRAIEIVNCRLRNSAGYALQAVHSSIAATGCEFAEGGAGVVYLRGGSHVIDHCTVSNNYLFSFMGGPMIGFANVSSVDPDGSGMPYVKAEITNTIVYGSGAPLSMDDLAGTEIFMRRCLIGVNGTDDDHFTDIIWGEDPLWWTDRSRYIFDYRLRDDSPALGASFTGIAPASALPLPPTDFYGNPHPSPASVGAMEVRQQ